MDIDVIKKENLCVGMMVDIVADEDKATQELTRGYIKDIVTKDKGAKRINVVLTSGKRGYVKHIVTKNELKKENFKFYNIFFFKDKIYSLWDKKANRFLVIEKINGITQRKERIAFLFTEKDIAQKLVKGTSLDCKDIVVREINRKKEIVENFKMVPVDGFSIDITRKLSFEKAKEWENYFKQMR